MTEQTTHGDEHGEHSDGNGPGRLRILHLSDAHLFGDGALHYGLVDTTAALARVLEAAADVSGIDAVVMSGDLSDDGTPASYRKLQGMVEPWAAARGADVVYAMGNHDNRSGFREVLGPCSGEAIVAGVRIMRLDSSVPGAGFGRIDDEHLAWLRRELAVNGAPTIVVLHHPPTPGSTPLLAGLALQNAAELLDICSSAGVLAIIAGHYHHPLVTAERGVPLIIAPGIANTTDVHAPAGRERAKTGSGYAVIDFPLGGPGGDTATRPAPRVTVHAAPGPDDGRVIFDLSDDEVAAITAKAGPRN
jgi:predicted MPP superfamily phosphohydrolase